MPTYTESSVGDCNITDECDIGVSDSWCDIDECDIDDIKGCDDVNDAAMAGCDDMDVANGCDIDSTEDNGCDIDVTGCKIDVKDCDIVINISEEETI